MGPDLEIHKPLQIRDCSYRGKPGKAVLIMFKNNGSAAAENARAELSSAGGAPETLALGSVPAKQGFGQPKQIGPCFDKDARISVKLIAQNDTNSMNNEAGANIVVGGKTSPVAIANPGAVMNTASPGIKNSIGISPIASPPTTVVDPTRGPNALSASGLSVDLGVCLYHGLTGNISRCANKLSDAKVRLTNITNQPITFVNASGTPSSLHLVAGEALVEPFFIVGPGHDKKVLNPGESDEFYYDARGAAGGVGTLSVAGNIYFKVGNGSQIFSKKISRSLNKVKQGYLDWYDVAGPIAFNVAPSQSQTKTVTIKNFGNTGSIVSTQVVPADPRIVVLQSCTGPLSGNSQCTISIRFDQSANPTPYAGKLRVSMDQGHPYVSFSTTMDIEKDLFGYINCPNGGTAGTGGCQ
ncbi:MAG TPA: hypothetical protein PLH57_00930 [Oligoflexia bacterium]|nr:hypothetical protein [Oligoflexia bacterium]